MARERDGASNHTTESRSQTLNCLVDLRDARKPAEDKLTRLLNPSALWSFFYNVLTLTSRSLALYTSHCCAMLLVPFASNFWAYSATLSSISRSFLRRLSSISVTRGVSEAGAGGSSILFGESSLTEGLRIKKRKYPPSPKHNYFTQSW